MRKPNTACLHCELPVYKRPGQLNAGSRAFCGQDCYHAHVKMSSKTCQYCKQEFSPRHTKQKFCSKECGGSSRRGMKYLGHGANKNLSKARLSNLQSLFDFSSCMVFEFSMTEHMIFID